MVGMRICPKCGSRDFVEGTVAVAQVSAPAPQLPSTAQAAAAAHVPTPPLPAGGGALGPSIPNQPKPLRVRVKNTQAKMLKPWAVGVMLCIMCVVGLGFLKTGEGVADWAVSRTSVEYERQLADSLMTPLEASGGLAARNDPAHELVNRLGQQLVAALEPATKYQYRFHVANDRTINAFALPGGDVVIHRGMLSLINRPEQLAAVLAHEIQHVERQHGLRKSYQQQSLGAIMVLTFGLSMYGGYSDVLSIAGLSYSRKLETEADIEGALLLEKAGIARGNMVDMLQLLAKAQEGPSGPVWLSSHPDSNERAKRVASGK